MPSRRRSLLKQRAEADKDSEENLDLDAISTTTRRKSKRVSFSTDLTEVREFRIGILGSRGKNGSPAEKIDGMEFLKQTEVATASPVQPVNTGAALSQTIFEAPASDDTIRLNETLLNNPQGFDNDLKSSSTPQTEKTVKKSDFVSNDVARTKTRSNNNKDLNKTTRTEVDMDMTAVNHKPNETFSISMASVNEDSDIAMEITGVQPEEIPSNMPLTMVTEQTHNQDMMNTNENVQITETIELQRRDVIAEHSQLYMMDNISLVKPVTTSNMSKQKEFTQRMELTEEISDSTLSDKTELLVSILTGKASKGRKEQSSFSDAEMDGETKEENTEQLENSSDAMVSEEPPSSKTADTLRGPIDEEMPEGLMDASDSLTNKLQAKYDSDSDPEIILDVVEVTGFYEKTRKDAIAEQLQHELETLKEIQELEKILAQKKESFEAFKKVNKSLERKEAKLVSALEKVNMEWAKKTALDGLHEQKLAQLDIFEQCTMWNCVINQTSNNVVQPDFTFPVTARYTVATLKLSLLVRDNTDLIITYADCGLTDILVRSGIMLARVVVLKSMLDTVSTNLDESVNKRTVSEVLHMVSGLVAKTASLLLELEHGDECTLFHMTTDGRLDISTFDPDTSYNIEVHMDGFNPSNYPNERLKFSVVLLGNTVPEGLQENLMESLYSVKKGDFYITRLAEVIHKTMEQYKTHAAS